MPPLSPPNEEEDVERAPLIRHAISASSSQQVFETYLAVRSLRESKSLLENLASMRTGGANF
jgi:hypothetical protein